MKTNYFAFTILFFLFGCSQHKKESEDKLSKDSLSIYFSKATNSEKLDDIPNIDNYTNKAFTVLKNGSNDSVTRDNLFKVANNYFSTGNWNAFNSSTKLVLRRAIEKKDTVSIAKAYRFKAEYYKNIKFNDSAFYFYLKAEKLYTKLNDKLSLGRVFLKKGIVQFYANDYLGADISTSQAYNLLRNADDKEIVYQALSMIGIISNEMKDYKRAIEKHTEALSIVRKYGLNNSLHQESTSLNNIGNVYQNLNLNKEAVDNFKLALADKALERDTPDLYAILIDNLAYSNFKLKDYDDLPYLFLKSLRIRDSLKLSSGIVLSKIHLSEYFAEQKDTVQSQSFAIAALSNARNSRTPSDILAALKQLSSVEHKGVSGYSKEYIRINDSLQQAERKSQNKFARIQLETDEIILEKDKLAEQNRSLLYFFLGTMFIGILLFVIRAQRARNRELLLTQAQQKANEDIYNLMISQQGSIEESRVREKKRIAQELHDGVLGRLFGARLNLDSLNRASDDESIASRFNYLSELKNIEQDIREISHDLNREKFVLINNFVAIVNNLLEEQSNSHAADIISHIDEKIQWDVVSNAIKINLYRILQESLQNINKYAQAESVTVDFKRENDTIVLRISDNGVGFETNSKKKGIGLQNMVSRVNECNGSLDVASTKGKGTMITVTIPLVSENAT